MRLLILIILLAHTACAAEPASALTRYEFTQPEMGIPFRLVFYGSGDESARAAARAAFQRVKELNQIFSDYDPESELSRLSQSAGQSKAMPVSPPLWTVLTISQDLSRKSGGAFDITVGPVVQLWRKARRLHRLPPQNELQAARAAVGYTNLLLDMHRHTAQLRLPKMRLDLGAIAKGYAIDQALAVLKQHGFATAFVSGSGDMAFGDPPSGEKGWRIEIAALDFPNAPPKKTALLSRMALATSGDLFQHLEIDGKRYSHIVDPQTGIGLTDHSLVTVIAAECVTADSLATTVSVLGPAKGLELIATVPGASVHIVRAPNGRIEEIQSPNFGPYLAPE